MDETEAGRLLREISRLHGQVQRNEVAICCDATSTECHILTELGHNSAMIMGELVRRLNVDKGWTSRVVEGMAQEGLLVKEPNPNDKRTVIVTLTAAGQVKADEVDQTLNTQSSRFFLRIPAAERPAVFRALELLHQALQSDQAGEAIPVTQCCADE